MMDNLDLNMVKDSVIYKSVEKQHLLTPDYWLTSVLISIMNAIEIPGTKHKKVVVAISINIIINQPYQVFLKLLNNSTLN
jgi:hypothetical protein